MSNNEPIYSKPIPKYNQNKHSANRSTSRSINTRNDHMIERPNDKYTDCLESNASELSYKNRSIQGMILHEDLITHLDYNGQLERGYIHSNSSDLNRSKLRSSNSKLKHNPNLDAQQQNVKAIDQNISLNDRENLLRNNYVDIQTLETQPLYANEPKYENSNKKLELDINSDDYGFLNFEANSRRFVSGSTRLQSPKNEFNHSETKPLTQFRNRNIESDFNKYDSFRSPDTRLTQANLMSKTNMEEVTVNVDKRSSSKSYEHRSKHLDRSKTHEKVVLSDKMTERKLANPEQYYKSNDHRSSITKRPHNSKQIIIKNGDAGGEIVRATNLVYKSPKLDTRLKSEQIDHETKNVNKRIKSHGSQKESSRSESSRRAPRTEVLESKQLFTMDQAKRFYCRDWAFRKIAQCLEQRPMSRTCGTLILGGSGSGKTTLCREIGGQNGSTNINKGTLGTLNRKLLAVYYVQAQNSDTLSMADFIRSLVLQLISHSTYLQNGSRSYTSEQISPQKTLSSDSRRDASSSFARMVNKELSLDTDEILEPIDNSDLLNIKHDLERKLEATELDNEFCKDITNLCFEDTSLDLKTCPELEGGIMAEDISNEGITELSEKKIEDIEMKHEILDEVSNLIDVEETCESFDQRKQCSVIRQYSDPSSYFVSDKTMFQNLDSTYFTHPPSAKGQLKDNDKIEAEGLQKGCEVVTDKKTKFSPSKIPIAHFKHSKGPNYTLNLVKNDHRTNQCLCNEEISLGGESIANMDNIDASIIDQNLETDILDDSILEQNSTKSECESTKLIKDESKDSGNNSCEQTINQTPSRSNDNDSTSTGIESLHKLEINRNLKPPTKIFKPQHKFESVFKLSESNPPPLPSAPQNSRNYIANAYFEKLLTDTEIQESLNIENIDKNPDDCFKKALLFPLLEIDPPKNCLLFIVDSIDEKSLTNCNLNNTLTKEQDKPNRSINNSKTIAELLANHHHLFPQWLLLVCTARKQSKNLTKMFTGFRKISLDDLRKNQIVRDVQQYILARLDTEMNLRQHISRDTAEMLNQLHIKSNGCFLYLEKVLDGVSDNFIVLREIKEIPGTLNGLYLWLCQRLFNKKQFSKVKPLFNILLAARNKVTKEFLYKCLLTSNYTISKDDFTKRLNLLRKVVRYDGSYLNFFHQSFAEWLVDVKHCTQKYLCSVLEGSCMIAMYYTLHAKSLCINEIHNYTFHLTKVEQYLNTQVNTANTAENPTEMDWHFITLMWLIDSGCYVEKSLFCGNPELCDDKKCQHSKLNENLNITQKTKEMIQKYYIKANDAKLDDFVSKTDTDIALDEINEAADTNNKENELKFKVFLNDFFKPTLSRDNRVLRLLLEAGAKTQVQDCTSSQISLDSITDTQSVSYLNPSEEQMDDLYSLEDAFQIDTSVMVNGSNIIHTLASEGNAMILEKAIQSSKTPIDVEAEDRHGQTALNLAARHGHTNVVKVLLKAGALPDHADCDGWTALRAAAWGGHTEVVELLVSHGCDVDRPDSDGRSALRAAAWSGHEDIVKVLLKAGASVNRTDQEGRTALIAAAYMGHSEIVEQLLDCGADINHSDADGRSALSVAALCVPASAGYAKVVGVLLERGAKPDHQDKEGMTPLLVAAFEGHREVCELLLESEAEPDLAENTGRVPLWGACSAGHSSVVELLLFWGAGIDCMDHEGRTVLSVACAQGNVEVVRQLLDRGLDETHRDNAGWTPLHYAAFEGHLEVVQALLESGAKVDEADNDGKSCLHLASQEGHSEVIQALLTTYSAPVDQRAHDGKTALRLAALEGHYEALRLLIQHNADVNTKDADGRSTLYILALENKLAMARFLLEHGRADPNCRDCEGRTALHVSAWQGHTDMVSLLISAGGATTDALDNDCRTPLHSACWQGHSSVVELLLKWGAQPDHACNQGATALGIASQEGHYECVVKLLQYNADPHHSDHCGRTPLKLATKSQRTEVVRLLEAYIKTRKTGSSNNSITSGSTAIIRSPNVSPESTHRLSCQSIDNNFPTLVDTVSQSITQCQSLGNHSSLSSNLTGSTHSSKHEQQSNQSIPFSQQLQSFTRYGHTNAVTLSNPYTTHVLSPLNSDSGSPLYASPPHSPISDIASPVNPPLNSIGGTVVNKAPENHFSRDTHMRIILGSSSKDKEQIATKSKRNAIATNPAFRLIRSGLDSAAANLRRTGQALSQSHRSSDKSKSNETEGGATKSGTFQWRRETPL